MRTTQQAKIQIIDAFLVCLVTEHIQANPLYRMENNQAQAKEQVIDDRNRVRDDFLHRVEMWVKGRKKKYLVAGDWWLVAGPNFNECCGKTVKIHSHFASNLFVHKYI